MFALAWLRFPLRYWTGFICVGVATALTIAIFEHGEWPLGLFVPPRLALRELVIGIAWGVALIGGCASLVVLSTDVRHEPGRGFPWLELVTVFIPAAVHEELLFRGYPFQKLLRWNRMFALVFVALVFAALHANNTAVTALGLTNIFLGGILLGLAYERYHRLWFPIGLHLAWNLMTGPILGHEVSGYYADMTLFVERGDGAWWLTGGEFGIEGSAWMTVVEVVGIVLLMRMNAERRTQNVRALSGIRRFELHAPERSAGQAEVIAATAGDQDCGWSQVGLSRRRSHGCSLARTSARYAEGNAARRR